MKIYIGKHGFAILLIVTYLQLVSCIREKQQPVILNGEAQGTYFAITYFDDEQRDFSREIDSLFRAFDQSASIYQKQSVISRFNRNDTATVADDVFISVYRKAEEVSKKTGGAFDITVMPLVNAWGFGFRKKESITPQLIDSLLPLVGYKKIKLINGKLIKQDTAITIDFNAIAQGYSCDVIGYFLESRGINNYLIDVGGEVLGKGNKPDGEFWKVGIEKPAKDSISQREIEVVVELKNKALATSGNYRKYYIEGGRRFSHTIDPVTGYPVNHSVLSVSVMANDCMTADAFATAFMVMGLEKTRDYLQSNSDLEVLIIYDDNGVLQEWSSDGFGL